ncbi:major facilitator superfamily domain-containing protein [Aspergillus keveii]|uniref:Major facilitator superfamily domain-containing protein n=1 Tax=Aspergillus keveii TaxID=714993 RepID=A0ABR4FZR1_9EURO
MAPKGTAHLESNDFNEVDVRIGDIELPPFEIIDMSDKLVVRKIDRWLMLLMGVTYMLQFLDKQTLSQTSIMGFIEDIDLTGNQFSWAGSIFYFGYLAFSLLPTLQPYYWFLWTVILVYHAAMTNFAGVMVLYFLLGAAEASISPGFTLLMGIWYTREEQPIRDSLWFAGSPAASAFGGIICLGSTHIHTGIETWRLLYLIYVAITLFWTHVFLTPAERTRVVERVRENQTGLKESVIQLYQIWEALEDYKVWVLVLYQLSSNIPNGAMLVFAVLVTKGVLGCLLIYKLEGKVVPLIGILLYMASVAGMPLSFSLISANIAGFTKRATVSAMVLIAYCAGNLISPFLFFEHEVPQYKRLPVDHICFCVAVASIAVLRIALRDENRRRDRPAQDAVVSLDGNENASSHKEGIAETGEMPDLTDKENRNFRYVY